MIRRLLLGILLLWVLSAGSPWLIAWRRIPVYLPEFAIELVRRGERVFAVAGLSDAVKLDAAPRAALEL